VLLLESQLLRELLIKTTSLTGPRQLNRRYEMVIKTESREGYYSLFLEDYDVTGLLNIEQNGESKAEVCAAALKRFDKLRAKLNQMEEAVLKIRTN
jgi:hypothetical protein